MFSSALKSISATNISANYAVSPTPVSAAGAWKIFDAKKKSTGKQYSVFVFDRKSLDGHGSALSRSGAATFRRTVDDVVERLRKEASSLAKLRHPNILELVEPVEDTRGGGLQFVTEAVSASLASVLRDKDDEDRAGGRASRFVAAEDADGGRRRRRELEIDELEIQKGLLQVSRALEFLHENAGLVHGNLTPDAILINAKSDWKISGLAFCSPAENSTKPTSIQGINLHEVLNPDPRLPLPVQLSIDYTSPDFVLDNSLNPSADMFSLGLVSIALYNSPHKSPIECHGSLSSYKRLFSSSSTIPSSSNSFLSSRPLPKELSSQVLPRLITRRPAQRMTAREFQQSEYFDNVLVSTIRFLESFPAKTPNEKSQFLRGLVKVLPSFPKSVMEKKILPGLLEELKDRDLLSLILQNIFKIVELLPSAKRAFGQLVRPALKEIFVVNSKQVQEKDAARDAGLMVFLENLPAAADNSSGKEFKDAIECPTHAIIDAALRCLPTVLPVLDFSTIKNELFPVVAAVFSRTNSLAIKVRGLQAFVILCGGTPDAAADDGLNGLVKRPATSSALDKYTMQEKIVPLIKAIKTKEPAVMVAALNVLRIVGHVADADFVAMDILPVLWSMSLGPLLDLKQFQTFMELIRSLSRRVEDEQTRKLQETSSAGVSGAVAEDFMAFAGVAPRSADAVGGGSGDDFEALVKGRPSDSQPSWDEAPKPAAPATSPRPQMPSFSWSSQSVPGAASASATTAPSQHLNRFAALTPSSTTLQPTTMHNPPASQQAAAPARVNWSSTAASPSSNTWTANSSPTANTWTTNSSATPNAWTTNSSPGLNAWTANPSPTPNAWAKPPQSTSPMASFSLPPPPTSPLSVSSAAPRQPTMAWPAQAAQQQQKTGLDKYESLI